MGIKLLDLLINIYFVFVLTLFITDYSFIFKNGFTNISGFAAALGVLLFFRLRIDKETFSQILILKKAAVISKLTDKQLLIFFFLIIAVSLSSLGIARHISLSTKAWDMGIFDQAIWNTLRGNFLFCSIRGNLNLLGDHFEPILLLLVPFYSIWPHIFNLIIIQALLLGSAVFPLYLIAKEKLDNRFLVFSFIAAFYLSKPLRGVGLSDFHPEGFVVGLTLWAFYFLIKEKRLLFIFSTLLLLLCKESTVFIVLGIGFYALITLKRKTTGILLILTAISMWIIETRYIIPLFNTSDQNYFFFSKMPFGNTYKQNLLFIISKPWEFIKFLFLPEKIGYIFKLTGPFCFLSFLSINQYVLVFFPLLINLMGNSGSGFHKISSHYVAQVLPLIFITAIYGLSSLLIFLDAKIRKVNLRIKARLIIASAIILSSLIFYGKTDAYKFRKFIEGSQKIDSFTKLSYLSLIPKQASVSAVSNLVPHLSQRKFIYDWNPNNEVCFMTEYVVIDLDFLTGTPYNSDNLPEIFKKLNQKGYRKLFISQDGRFFIYVNPQNSNRQLQNYHFNS